MEKKLNLHLIFNTCESVLFGTVFYLLCKPSALDWVMVAFVFLCLLEAMASLIKKQNPFVWSKVVLGFGICWAMLTMVLQVLFRNVESMDCIGQVMPVWSNITLVISGILLLAMLVGMITVAILLKRKRWKFDMSEDKILHMFVADYTAVALLLLACYSQF